MCGKPVILQKRHFEALAEAMQELTRYAHNGASGPQVADQACRLLADLGRSNPHFDRSRFLAACTPGNNVRARTSEPSLIETVIFGGAE